MIIDIMYVCLTPIFSEITTAILLLSENGRPNA